MPSFLPILRVQGNYIDYIFILLLSVKHRTISSLYYLFLPTHSAMTKKFLKQYVLLWFYFQKEKNIADRKQERKLTYKKNLDEVKNGYELAQKAG